MLSTTVREQLPVKAILIMMLVVLIVLGTLFLFDNIGQRWIETFPLETNSETTDFASPIKTVPPLRQHATHSQESDTQSNATDLVVPDSHILTISRKQALKRMNGLRRQVEEHLEKIANNPNSQAVEHWKNEIKSWLNEIERLSNNVGKKTQQEWSEKIQNWRKQLED